MKISKGDKNHSQLKKITTPTTHPYYNDGIKMIRTCAKIRCGPISAGSMLPRMVASNRHVINRTNTLRFNSTESAAAATPAAKAEDVGELPSEKIVAIVDSISQLTLLETSELIKHLQKKLNLPESSGMMMNPGMMMQGQGAVAGASAAGKDAGDSAAAAEEEEKATFTVKLASFDTKSKAKVIKEIKSLLGLSLVEAKKFVEAAPRVVKEHLGKEESEALKTKLESLGAKVELD